MIMTFAYLFVNNFVVDKIIIGKANYEEIKDHHTKAIGLYNIAYGYYKFNHYTEDNKTNYFELPYKMALCNLEANKKSEAAKNMLKGIKAVQGEYGVFSQEYAYFIRKYLIDYYLVNENYNAAAREYQNLLIIYKKTGYTNSDTVDMLRLKGDLAYAQGENEIAMGLYKQALQSLPNMRDIDYKIYFRILTRMCNYDVENKNGLDAIIRYQKAISFLKKSGKKQRELTAQCYLQLGEVYMHQEKAIKSSILCYEDAIKIIETLPSTTFSKQHINEYLTTLKGLYDQDGQFHKVDEVEVQLTRIRRFSFL